MERAIVNRSRTGDIVLDQFSGSGSTLIACERTGRMCRTIELDPKFFDVPIKRWKAYKGREAIFSNYGKTFTQIKEKTHKKGGKRKNYSNRMVKITRIFQVVCMLFSKTWDCRT